MKIKNYILLAGLFIISISATAQQKGYKGNMSVEPLQLEQKGDSLHIKLFFDVNGVRVDSRRSISLFPVLVASQIQIPLSEVMVKGRSDYKLHKRHLALMNKSERAKYELTAPYAIIKGYKSKDAKTIEYNKVIPYESWMANARMDIQEDLCGCGNPPRTIAISTLINKVQPEAQIEPYQINPTLAYVIPQLETIKHREMTGEAFLDFVVDKTDIRPNYMNNPQELKKITDMITKVKADKDITVSSISVIGYASPEGSIENNKYLSKERAKALAGYLTSLFDYPHSLYKIEYGEENWKGLNIAVEKMDWQYKEDVLAILKNIPEEQNINRKKSLQELKGGEPYRYLLKEIFPSLRVAICKINYVVKGFDVVAAKELINTNPQDLSLNEMFLVANTYENGSKEFIEILELAAQIHPEDQTANINAASAALANKDTKSAEKYLERINPEISTPELNNAKGVLSMLKGDYDLSEQYLKAAADKGLEAAKANLTELSKKRENIETIKK